MRPTTPIAPRSLSGEWRPHLPRIREPQERDTLIFPLGMRTHRCPTGRLDISTPSCSTRDIGRAGDRSGNYSITGVPVGNTSDVIAAVSSSAAGGWFTIETRTDAARSPSAARRGCRHLVRKSRNARGRALSFTQNMNYLDAVEFYVPLSGIHSYRGIRKRRTRHFRQLLTDQESIEQ